MRSPVFPLAPVVAALLLLAAWTPRAEAQGAEAQASDFLSALQDRAIEELTDSTVPEAERGKRFRAIFRENFDLDAIGKFVVGRYWRSATPQERQDFLTVFEDVMVQRFLPLLTQYSGQKFEIGGAKEDARSDDMIIVSTKIAREEGEPYHVNWRIRNREGRFMILDIIAEGVSMAITLRSEYNAVLKTSDGNVRALTDALRQKLKDGEAARQSQ